MNNNKGYTSFDIIFIIILLGVSALLILPKVSLAFSDESENIYQDQINLYLKQAKKYGEDNIDKLRENDNTIVLSVEELIEEKYIGADIYEEENNKNIRNLKIQITYNEENNSVKTEYI